MRIVDILKSIWGYVIWVFRASRDERQLVRLLDKAGADWRLALRNVRAHPEQAQDLLRLHRMEPQLCLHVNPKAFAREDLTNLLLRAGVPARRSFRLWNAWTDKWHGGSLAAALAHKDQQAIQRLFSHGVAEGDKPEPLSVYELQALFRTADLEFIGWAIKALHVDPRAGVYDGEAWWLAFSGQHPEDWLKALKFFEAWGVNYKAPTTNRCGKFPNVLAYALANLQHRNTEARTAVRAMIGLELYPLDRQWRGQESVAMCLGYLFQEHELSDLLRPEDAEWADDASLADAFLSMA